MLKKIIAWVMMVMLVLAISAVSWAASSGGPKAKKQVLCTTFPMYLITKNITKESKTVEVELMLPAAMGCPHDYTLKPQDMQKLARADVLVVNGLGLEEFLGAPVDKANPKLKTIDSSAGIKELLNYSEMGEDHHEDHEKDGREDHAAEEHEHHHHEGVNPHLFASPRRMAMLAENIARQLNEQDPKNTALYTRNAREYAAEMNNLADALVKLGKRLKNNRIVTQHGAFDYLAHDMGLEIVAVVAAHAGQEPSAADMLAIVKTIREKKVGAIFTEPQYPQQIGKRLAQEAGISMDILDPVANGPENAGMDYYQRMMWKNMGALEKNLGVQ